MRPIGGEISQQSRMRLHAALALLLSLQLLAGSAGCAYHARSTAEGPLAKTQLAQLWQEPDDVQSRDLFYGVGGKRFAPATGAPLKLKKDDYRVRIGRVHRGYDVVDANGVEWSVKLGSEAQTEVVASRLLWAIGFHQVPVYYVPSWRLQGGTRDGHQDAARFRAKLPTLKKGDDWSWHENPFVGTPPLRGLFVFNVIINNWDLKSQQNAIYHAREPWPGPSRWYVINDLGGSFGNTRWFFSGSKNDINDFEHERFIKGVDDQGNVEFYYRGGWREPHLSRRVTVADVQWTCERLNRLTDAQWHDAFRAAGYEPAVAERYIRKLRQKIAEGLALRAASS